MSFFISDALAEGTQAAAQPGGEQFILLIGMVVLFYFILIRPQQKRAKEHKKMVSEISKGDEVVTNGGVLGKVTQVGEQYLSLEVAENVEIKLQIQAVGTVLPKGSIKAAKKD